MIIYNSEKKKKDVPEHAVRELFADLTTGARWEGPLAHWLSFPPLPLGFTIWPVDIAVLFKRSGSAPDISFMFLVGTVRAWPRQG